MEELSDVYELILRIDKRIDRIREDSDYILMRMDEIMKKKDSMTDELHAEIISLHKSFDEIKQRLNTYSLHIVKLSKMLKHTMKKDQLELLKNSVDAIKFEDFITKKELDRLI